MRSKSWLQADPSAELSQRPAIVSLWSCSWRDSLRQIQAPTLLIAGGPTSHVDQGQLADMATLIPDCELVTIPAGHLVHAARPAEFVAVVTGFLSRPLTSPRHKKET